MANTSPSSSPSTATTPTTAIQDSIDKAKSFNIYLTLVNYKCNYYCSEVKMDYLNFQKVGYSSLAHELSSNFYSPYMYLFLHYVPKIY